MWSQIGKERIFSDRAPEGNGAAWDCFPFPLTYSSPVPFPQKVLKRRDNWSGERLYPPPKAIVHHPYTCNPQNSPSRIHCGLSNVPVLSQICNQHTHLLSQIISCLPSSTVNSPASVLWSSHHYLPTTTLPFSIHSLLPITQLFCSTPHTLILLLHPSLTSHPTT